jgi:hypothetical protein
LAPIPRHDFTLGVAWWALVSTRAAHSATLAILGETLLNGPGHASPAVRAAAAAGEGEGALGAYLAQVQNAAHKVTSEQVSALQKSHSDDVLFEVTVCAAFGAAKKRHDAGLAAIDAAWKEEA